MNIGSMRAWLPAILALVVVPFPSASAAPTGDLARLSVGATARVGSCFVVEFDDPEALSDVATTEVQVAYAKGNRFDNLTWLKPAPLDAVRVIDPSRILLSLKDAGMSDDLFLPNWLDKVLYGEKLAIRFRFTRSLRGETESQELSTVIDLKKDPKRSLEEVADVDHGAARAIGAHL